MDTGWLCIGLFILAVLSFIGHLIWLGIGRALGFGKTRQSAFPPAAEGDAERTHREIDALFHANLIDAATHQRVTAAIHITQARARQRVALAPQLPPFPKMAVLRNLHAPTPLASIETPAPVESPEAQPIQPLPEVMPEPVQAAAVNAPVIVTPQPFQQRRPPAPPRRSLSDVFAGFMRESNIRWGELIGGMLILGGSIALVISFWSEIAHHSFLRFAIFTGVTAAMLGLGLYAGHRWKLPTTSRGILLIATLLVPLNFLAFAAISHGAVPTGIESAIQVGALALFGFMVWRAAVVLSPYWPKLLTTGVLGPSAALVLIQRFGIARSAGLTIGMGAVPVSIYCAVIGIMLARASRWKRLRPHVIEAVFVLLGLATFAAAASVGLVVLRAASPWHAAHFLSPLLSLATAPSLAVGLLIWTRVGDRRLTRLRVVGTTIAVAAAILDVGALGLAWPDPQFLVPLGVTDFLVFSAIAFWFAIPAGHLLAMPYALIAYLAGYHVLRGNLTWTTTGGKTLDALLDPAGGAALVGLFGLFAAASYVLRRIARTPDAWFYRRAALGVAIASFGLVTRTAFSWPYVPSPAAWVYGVYAIAAFVAAARLGWLGAAWVGCMLLIAASVQWFLTRSAFAHPWTIGLLTAATVEAAGGLAIRQTGKLRATLGDSLKWTATFAAGAAATLLLPVATLANAPGVGGEILWAAALWFVIAIAESSEPIFIAAEVALGAGTAIIVVGRLATHPWFVQSNVPLLHPWTLQAIGIALATIPMIASIARRLTPTSPPIGKWLRSAWSVDRGLLVILTAGLTILLCAAEFDAIRIEFALRGPRGMLSAWSTHVGGYGSWILLVILLITLLDWISQATESRAPLLLILVALLGCPLLSLRSANDGSAASLLRWLLSIAGLTGGAALWFRHRLPGIARRSLRHPIATDVRALLVALCAVPVIALSVYPASLALQGQHILGAAAHTFFARIGNASSYTIPLGLVALVFLGHAIRDRSGSWASAATGVFNLTATLAYLLAVSGTGKLWDFSNTLRLVQINVLVLGGFALGWLYVRRFVYRNYTAHPPAAPAALKAQVAIASIGVAFLMVVPTLGLMIAPSYALNLDTIGDPVGSIALFVTFTALLILTDRLSAPLIASISASTALMLACSASHYDPTHWLAFHVLMAALLAAASATFAAGLWMANRLAGEVIQLSGPLPDPAPQEPAQAERPVIPLQYHHPDPTSKTPNLASQAILRTYLNQAGSLSLWLIVLATRAMLSDPQRPIWSTSCTLMLSILWLLIACRVRTAPLLYIGGLLPNLAATFWWFDRPLAYGPGGLLNLLTINAAVLATMGLAGLVIHVHVFSPKRGAIRHVLPAFHRFALNVVTTSLMVLAYFSAGHVLGLDLQSASPFTTIPALLIAGALAMATLADEQGFALGQLYVIGLSAVVIDIGMLHLPGRKIEWAYQLGLCAFVSMTGMLYAARGVIAQLLSAIGLAPSVMPRRPEWLKIVTVILATTGVCLAFRLDFVLSESSLRVTAATAALLQLAGLALLAPGDRDLEIRRIVIILGTAGMVGWVWSWMPPSGSTPLLRACAGLLGASVALGLAAGSCRMIFRGDRSKSLWIRALTSTAPVLAVFWMIACGTVIGFEAEAFIRTHSVQLPRAWVLISLLVFLLATISSVALGARGVESDPLNIRPARRGAYIYAAEALLVTAFVHLRLTMPWLFGGLLSHFWPLVIMAIAFAGVGAGELLARRNRAVVSAPLLATGIFLPILPVLAFGLAPSRVDFATLLFLIGFFYAVISVTRQSFAIGMLATLAANGGLWSLLYRRPELRLMVHPQLWMIPAALSVLIAAQLNVTRLKESQLRFIRYTCLMIVYISSTADVFLNGVRDHPFLPIILACLSVAGVMLGILFRMRAFLFLGTAFLGLAIVTMIYYASANLHWTWVWYVAVIVLGAAIIALFALFEKKRTEMLALVEGLKSWQ